MPRDQLHDLPEHLDTCEPSSWSVRLCLGADWSATGWRFRILSSNMRAGEIWPANWWRSAASKKGRRPRSSRRCRGATSPSLRDSRTLF